MRSQSGYPLMRLAILLLGGFCIALLSLAFRRLAFAAAFDALIAISLRLLAPSFLARASPPSLASSERILLINASSIGQILHLARKVGELNHDFT